MNLLSVKGESKGSRKKKRSSLNGRSIKALSPSPPPTPSLMVVGT